MLLSAKGNLCTSTVFGSALSDRVVIAPMREWMYKGEIALVPNDCFLGC